MRFVAYGVLGFRLEVEAGKTRKDNYIGCIGVI